MMVYLFEVLVECIYTTTMCTTMLSPICRYVCRICISYKFITKGRFYSLYC